MQAWRNLRTFPERGKSHSHHSPPILYPISYSILDPIIRLVLSFKVCSKERRIPNSNRTLFLSLYPCVYHLLPAEGFGSSDSQDITEIRLQRTQAHWHMQEDTCTEEHSKETAYERLGFWERCPCAFVWSRIPHPRHTLDHFVNMWAPVCIE